MFLIKSDLRVELSVVNMDSQKDNNMAFCIVFIQELIIRAVLTNQLDNYQDDGVYFGFLPHMDLPGASPSSTQRIMSPKK